MTPGCRALGLPMTAFFFLLSCAGTPRVPTAPLDKPQPTETAAPTTVAPSEFVATEELKKKTFEEVAEVIDALDRIIADGDYSQWLGFLTDEYARSRSSDAFLAAASEAAVLEKNGIVLRTLRDYFDNVVVRSRVQAKLDDIIFVDETHVKAYTRVQGKLYILYYLVRECDWWEIGIPPGGES